MNLENLIWLAPWVVAIVVLYGFDRYVEQHRQQRRNSEYFMKDQRGSNK